MIIATHGILANATLPSTLNNGLFSVYKAESNANDSLGVYNGTAQGGLTYTSGKSGNAFTGNGTNAYVSLPNNSHNFTGDFSVNMWINIASGTTGTEQELFSNLDNSNVSTSYGYRLQYGGLNNRMRFTIHSPTQVSLDAPYVATGGNFFMLTITRKASTRSRLYINGSLISSNASIINPVYTGTFATCIGVSKTTTYPLQRLYIANGTKIDEVVTWNRELTQVEITEAYNSGFGKFYHF